MLLHEVDALALCVTHHGVFVYYVLNRIILPPFKSEKPKKIGPVCEIKIVNRLCIQNLGYAPHEHNHHTRTHTLAWMCMHGSPYSLIPDPFDTFVALSFISFQLNFRMKQKVKRNKTAAR